MLSTPGQPPLTPGTPAAAAPRFYRPELDVLRFVAFLLVFIHHATPADTGLFGAIRIAGALGVCLFFLLSAYLITELLEREAAVSGTIHLRAFYARRVLRIWPLYFAMLLADFVWHRFSGPGLFTTPRLLAFLLLAGNWYVARNGFTWTPSTPLWSISVEEQFYVLWPSVRRFLGRTGALAFSLAMFAAAYVALAILCAHGVDIDTGIWVNSFVQFQFFSTGALLALSLRGRAPQISSAARLLLFALGLCALLASQELFHVKHSTTAPTLRLLAPGYLCAQAACILLFFSVLGAARLGRARALVYLGKISYGLYVFHLICLSYIPRAVAHLLPRYSNANLVGILVALAVTIALASASYHFFESPILRFKRRFEVVRTRPV